MKTSSKKYLKKQQGVVLFLALIVLVAMTLAGIAMVRSVDTSNLISGNMSFQGSALQESDLGIETAMVRLPLITSREISIPPYYFAVMQTAPALGTNGAPSSINAMTRGDGVTPADVYSSGFGANGNRVRLVIERMCNMVPAGALPAHPPATAQEIADNCMTVTQSGTDNSSRQALYILRRPVLPGNVYYRVTVRVDGPKNTVAMSQAILRF